MIATIEFGCRIFGSHFYELFDSGQCQHHVQIEIAHTRRADAYHFTPFI